MRRLAVAIVAVLAAAACGGGDDDEARVGDAQSTSSVTADALSTSAATEQQQERVRWELGEGGDYSVRGNPPACTDPILQPPADLSLATSILYPGQTRGNEYKPHGGFRFDDSVNDDITVVSPVDGDIVEAARYIVFGDVQHTFDIVNPCGIKVRIGHLLVLPSDMQALADTLPPAKENDSRTTRIEPPVHVEVGHVLATAVGVHQDTNTFFDFGVYDLRHRNKASDDPAYSQAHPSDTEQYAICWFDLLPPDAAARVDELPPGDPGSGTSSDYC